MPSTPHGQLAPDCFVEARGDAWQEFEVCLQDDVRACNLPVDVGPVPKTRISNVPWLASHQIRSKPAGTAASAPGLAPEQSEGAGSLWQCRGLRARGPGDHAWAHEVADRPQSLHRQKALHELRAHQELQTALWQLLHAAANPEPAVALKPAVTQRNKTGSCPSPADKEGQPALGA